MRQDAEAVTKLDKEISRITRFFVYTEAGAKMLGEESPDAAYMLGYYDGLRGEQRGMDADRHRFHACGILEHYDLGIVDGLGDRTAFRHEEP